MPLKHALNLAYPPVCEGCGDAYFPGEIPNLCLDCHESLLTPIVEPYCPVCGQSYDGTMQLPQQCGNCGARKLYFDFSIGAYLAEGRVLDWIHRFKYAGEIHFARCFGHLMKRVWLDQRLNEIDDWIVVPVPIHRKRLRERGFNQADEIAREWIRHRPDGKKLRLVHALKRIRHTSQQAALDRKERLKNLSGAFAMTRQGNKLRDKKPNILLVDDVLTTGTTASECGSVLQKVLSPNKIAIISVLRA